MLESIPTMIIIGTFLGFLSGLGIGGGSLLILWLTAVLGKDPILARSINLMFFIPSALIATFIRCKNQRINVKSALPGILTGCLFAILGTWISAKLDTGVVRKLFGAILILAGGRELVYRPRKAK